MIKTATTESTKRIRRTKEVLENDLVSAAYKLINENGFHNLSVKKLLDEAKADPPVFYNRYSDINDFIEKFIRKYDYWLNDSVHLNEKELSPIDNAENIIDKLIDSLLSNECMQKLLAWELNEDNSITRRSSQNRDNNSGYLIDYFEKSFKDCDVNFNVSMGILVGGVYYLICHRKMSTFNRVNFNTPEGIDALKKNLGIMLRKIYCDETKQNTIGIAKNLLKNNVEISIVSQCTGLTMEFLLTL